MPVAAGVTGSVDDLQAAGIERSVPAPYCLRALLSYLFHKAMLVPPVRARVQNGAVSDTCTYYAASHVL